MWAVEVSDSSPRLISVTYQPNWLWKWALFYNILWAPPCRSSAWPTLWVLSRNLEVLPQRRTTSEFCWFIESLIIWHCLSTWVLYLMHGIGIFGAYQVIVFRDGFRCTQTSAKQGLQILGTLNLEASHSKRYGRFAASISLKKSIKMQFHH